ncbi:hypothetical protein Tco_0311966 [Tanacetum coccineum]
MLLMQAQENGVALDEEQLLFIACGQDNVVDEDVDEQPVQDLALNVDNVFQADDCDAFDSNVDEAPTAQTMFMANLSSADPIIMKPVQVYMIQTINLRYQHETTIRMLFCEHHEVIRDLTMYNNYDDLLTADYMQEQVELYERWAKFELTEREQKIDEQLRIVITDQKGSYWLQEPFMSHPSKQVQPALYNGHEIIKTNHVPAIVHNSKDTLEIAETTRKKMNDKMKDPEKHDEIERKNLLIANDNLIVDCLSKEVFYIATNSELTVSRFTEMHDAHTVVQARCLELEADLSKLHDKVQKDDHNELVKKNSNFELPFKERTTPSKKLRMQISQLKGTRSEADRTLDFRALDFQITQLTEIVTIHQEQNELFRAENAKIKQHYKELYDSIKITRAKHIKQTTTLLTENENLKAQIHENLKCITMDSVKPKVLAHGRYAIDVEPIPFCVKVG